MCPSCGREVPEGAPEGLCPACVLKEAALASETEAAAATVPARLRAPGLEELAAAFPELEVIELIGCGGMGAVYKARQRKLNRLVALKVLPRLFGEDAGFKERFEREGRVLARLSHPHIVGVHDFGESGGFYFLLMEFVDGVNLRQAMAAGRFTPEQALKVVPDVCEALQFAHDGGVLHRDIKPENILLDAKGRVKIADFGIAKIVGDAAALEATLTGTGSLGTPQYMAPEQFETPREVDHRADIYSLGVVFYEMLTGELPMGRFAPPSEKSAVDARVDEIVMRALAKERELRQQSADEVRTEVEGVTRRGDARNPAAEAETVPMPVRMPVQEAPVNPWPRRVIWVLAAMLGFPFLLTVLVSATGVAAGVGAGLGKRPGMPGLPELLIIGVILVFGLAVLVGVVLLIVHLLGGRRHPPARATGAAANPWSRRLFWLVLAMVLVAVLVPVVGMVVWVASRELESDAARRKEAEFSRRLEEMDEATTAAERRMTNLVAGSWELADESANVTTTFTSTGRFTGTSRMGARENTASGTWRVEGDDLVQVIEESSDAQLRGKMERETILSIDDTTMVLRNKTEGEVETVSTYRRMGGADGNR